MVVIVIVIIMNTTLDVFFFPNMVPELGFVDCREDINTYLAFREVLACHLSHLALRKITKQEV